MEDDKVDDIVIEEEIGGRNDATKIMIECGPAGGATGFPFHQIE